ncbi:MAG: DUF2141 domain-containing protein [Pseudomonadota bacterium]
MTQLAKGALITLATLLPSIAPAEGLKLTVENVRNDVGSIVVLVFDKARAFNNLAYRRAVDYADIPARPGKVTHRFPELTAGPYAVFLFHDENGDWDLNYDTERLLEGVGATGAPNPEDMPDFDAASVWPGEVTVKMHYYE